MGPEYTTFGREKFNEMYEYYKNNSDKRMKLKELSEVEILIMKSIWKERR